MSYEGHICDGTGCTSPSVGAWDELREVPDWRRPDDRPADHRVFEIGRVVYFYDAHEDDAKTPSVLWR